jgi:hypothetical protein
MNIYMCVCVCVFVCGWVDEFAPLERECHALHDVIAGMCVFYIYTPTCTYQCMC